MSNFVDDADSAVLDLDVIATALDATLQATIDVRAAVRRGYGFLNVAAYGAVGDGVADDWDACVAALAAMSAAGSAGRVLYFPRGVYRLSKPLEISRTCVLLGDGCGAPNIAGATRLLFDAGSHGLVFQANNTSSDGGASSGSRVEDMEIVAKAKTATAHGVIIRAPNIRIDNCLVNGFAGNGVHIESGRFPNWSPSTVARIGDIVTSDSGKCYSCISPGMTADSGGPTGASARIDDGTAAWKYVYGLVIADSWSISRSIILCNTLHGICCVGGDSNVGVCAATSVLYNGGWGVYDSSFLGNTWIGLHASTNITGPYRTDNANARSLFLNCYSEGDQPASNISAPSQVYGGLHAAGLIGTWAGLVAGKLSPVGVGFASAAPPRFTLGDTSPDYSRLMCINSHDATNSLALRYIPSSSKFKNAIYWNYANGDGDGCQATGMALEPHVNNLGHRPRYLIPGTMFTFPSRSEPKAGGGGIFNEGQRIGHNRGVPVAGMWHEGDLSFETHPTAGGFVGYACIEAGTAHAYTEGLTATATGTTTVALNSNTDHRLGLQVGDRVLINGTNTFITAINNGRTIITTANAVAAGSGLVIATVAPVFKPFGAIGT